MRLDDVLELVARHGAERRAKQAGVVLPLAVGAMIPGIAKRAIERARSSEQMMQAGSHKTAAIPLQLSLPLAQIAQSISQGVGKQMMGNYPPATQGSGFRGSVGQLGGAPLGGVAKGVGDLAGSPLSGIAGGIQERFKRHFMGREFGEKKDPMSMAGGAALTSFGKEMGTTGANLLRDIANKAMEAVGQVGDDSARQAILGDLKRNDSVLAGADDKVLMESYHTMTRFAPVLSTDKNAVRSFLRQAVMSGSGPDFMSIKLLADSERAVTGEKKAGAAEDLLTLPGLRTLITRPALLGAGIGAGVGALRNPEHRGQGALEGAATGGLLGGMAGGGLGIAKGLAKEHAAGQAVQGGLASLRPNRRPAIYEPWENPLLGKEQRRSPVAYTAHDLGNSVPGLAGKPRLTPQSIDLERFHAPRPEDPSPVQYSPRAIGDNK